ncbi:unnamed protein product, partial [Didymodactylos carnosus]
MDPETRQFGILKHMLTSVSKFRGINRISGRSLKDINEKGVKFNGDMMLSTLKTIFIDDLDDNTTLLCRTNNENDLLTNNFDEDEDFNDQ